MQPQSDDQLETIGGRIRAAREAKALSVPETAIFLGMSRVQLYAWEKGTVTDMRVGQLVEFSKLTEVSLDWLLLRRGPDPEV